MKWVVLPYSELYTEETKCNEVKIYSFSWIQNCIRIIYNFSVFFICQHSCYAPTYFQTFSPFSKFQIQFYTNVALFIKGYNIEHLFRCKQCRNTFRYVVVKQILSRTHHLFHRNCQRFLHYDTNRNSLIFLRFSVQKSYLK